MESPLLRRLALSGLDQKDAKTLRVALRDTKFLKANCNGLPRYADAIEIPYFTPQGEPTGFARYRYLDHLTPKYAQPKGSEPGVYFPPLVDWPEVLATPAIPLWITEGEFKAAAGCKAGPPTVGLGGVWMFQRGKALLPALDHITWKGRMVRIVFDSDAATNPHVTHARNALCETLTARGAQPVILHLPPAANGVKQGLDDYLVAGGSVETLLEEGEAWREAQALLRLNEEVVYVENPGLIVRFDTGQTMAPRAFIDHAYATRQHPVVIMGPKGQARTEMKPTAREWIKWPHRAATRTITYLPGQPRLTPEAYNTWPGWGCKPEPGDVRLWHELLDFLFAGDAKKIHWFEQWCAYPLQHPGTKLYTACVLWGLIQGTGKTLVGYTLGKIFGKNFIEIKEKHLHSDFNFWAVDRQFVLGDEITGGDKRGTADYLKGFITQSEMVINPKHIQAYRVPDCINYLFTSNHPDAFFVEDSDRRFFVHEVRSVPLEAAWYQKYNAWYKGVGPSHLFDYLLHLDLDGFHPYAHAPDTRDKDEMIALGRSDIGSWVANLRTFPDETLQANGTPLQWSLATAQDLLALYDPQRRGKVTVPGMARELRKQGFRQVADGQPCRTRAGQVRLWAVRNRQLAETWSAAEAGKQYNKERGQ